MRRPILKQDVWRPQMSIFTMFISPSRFFTAIKQRTADHWLSTWNEVTNNKLRSIKNCIIQWPSSSQRIRHDEVILTRLRIGHTRVTHRFLMEICLIARTAWFHSVPYTYLQSVLHMTTRDGDTSQIQ